MIRCIQFSNTCFLVFTLPIVSISPKVVFRLTRTNIETMLVKDINNTAAKFIYIELCRDKWASVKESRQYSLLGVVLEESVTKEFGRLTKRLITVMAAPVRSGNELLHTFIVISMWYCTR